jgi:hypothetical protein
MLSQQPVETKQNINHQSQKAFIIIVVEFLLADSFSAEY